MVSLSEHLGRVGELSPNLRAEFVNAIAIAERAVDIGLKPDGINAGCNIGRAAGAGVDGHLHWHLVPRWNGDTNFLPVLGGAKSMPQYLDDTYETLLPHFSSD